MPRIVTRAEWKARAPKKPFVRVELHVRTAVCVHYDGAAPITVRTFDEACALMRKDEAYHMDHHGWNGIGYNYLVASAPGTPVDGLIFEGRGRDAVGAHCENQNTPWIGVQCAIGGDQQPSPAALASIRWLHDTFTRAARHPLAMRGHSDGYPTACPGPTLLAWVRAGMPVAGVTSKPSSTTPQNPAPNSTREDTTVKPFFMRRKDGAIVIVTGTGVRAIDKATWTVYSNLGEEIRPGYDKLDSGPWSLVIASLGGIVK